MAYVDDVRKIFDAADFCAIVSAGVGEGKFSSGAALRNADAAESALAALQAFHAGATSPEPPDVVNAYLHYSPAANELFTALRAVSTQRAIASAALDCLTAIVRYSLEEANPPSALESSRAVTKEVVKGRAVLIYDVFVNDSKTCAKKALNLLRLVAHCHPVLAKEILNRFNLASEVMAPLCSQENNHCRVPYLDLLFVLMASGDHDIAANLAAKSRAVLVGCLRVIKQRTLKESNPDHPDVVAELEQRQWNGKKKQVERKGQSRSDSPKKPTVTPSHIQKRELVAAINLLLAIQRHILWAPNHTLRRSAFAQPLPALIATIAAADMPPSSITPHQVTADHEALRSTACAIFLSIISDHRIVKAADTVSALNKIASVDSKAAVNFVIRIVEEKPQICKRLLETGLLLSHSPGLNSVWFGKAAIISACTLRLRSPTVRFAQTRFFEKCLSHDAGLVRRTGAVVMLAFCRVVESDLAALSQPKKYLPPRRTLELLLKQDAADELSLKLLAAYQKLVFGDAEEGTADFVKLSMENAGEHLALSDGTVRSALMTHPQNAVDAILRGNYLQKAVVRALEMNRNDGSKLWRLCHDILLSTGLFPSGTETEVDIYLTLLSSMGTEGMRCAGDFEELIRSAFRRQYALYDSIRDGNKADRYSGSECQTPCKLSLLSALACFRLRKMIPQEEKGEQDASDVDRPLLRVLQAILSTIISCQRLMRGATSGSGLHTVLPMVSNILPGLAKSLENETGIPIWLECATSLFSPKALYPRTPFLRLIKKLIVAQHTKSNAKVGPDMANYLMNTESGSLWSAWSKFRGSKECAALLDSYGQVELRHGGVIPVPTETFPGVSFGLFLEKTRQCGQGVDQLLSHVTAFKSTLEGDAVVLFIGTLLRATTNVKLCNYLLREAVSVLSGCENNLKNEAVTAFLEQAILLAVKREFKDEAMEIEPLISFSSDCLKKQSRAEFAVRILLELVTHVNGRIALLSRRYVANLRLVDLPRLQGSNLEFSLALALLLPFSQALQIAAILQVNRWSMKEAREAIPAALPILRTVLDAGAFTKAKEESDFVLEDTSVLILETLRTADVDAILSQNPKQARIISEAVSDIGAAITSRTTNVRGVMAPIEGSNAKDEGRVSVGDLLLLRNVFAVEHEMVFHADVNETFFVEFLTALLSTFSSFELDLHRYIHQIAVEVIHGVLKQIRRRKVDIYSILKNPSALEKSLTAFCSELCKGLHRLLDCAPPESERREALPCIPPANPMRTEPIKICLECISEVLTLDLVLGKVAERTLTSLGGNDGVLLLSLLQAGNNCQAVGIRSFSNRIASTLAAVVQVCLKHLPKFGVDAEVGTSLNVIEGILTLDVAGFSASCDIADEKIRSCMEALEHYMKVNDLRNKLQLVDRRTGYFRQTSSQMITMFTKSRLERTCEEVLRSDAGVTIPASSSISGGRAPMDTSENPYAPVFVLNTFVNACAEASASPTSAVLDIGKVAKQGVLGVAISGLAARDDTIRVLSYACLQAFSKIVGAFSGVKPGSASALYKERRQLAFLLTLMKNSVGSPKTKVLPLFAAWFRLSLRVALLPAHAANKPVTFFFLRAPVMDVTDCAGVSYLLRCEAFGAELKATRSLALEILRRGVHSTEDAIALRRRKIVRTLLSLGGSSLGIHHQLRDEVLSSLDEITSRDNAVGLSRELVFSYGIIPWLSGSSGENDTGFRLKRRLAILHHLCASFARGTDAEQYIRICSRAVRVLSREVAQMKAITTDSTLLHQLFECAELVCTLNSQRRELTLVEPSLLRFDSLLESAAMGKSKTTQDIRIARIVARQNHYGIDSRFYEFLLEVSTELLGTSFAMDSNMSVLKHLQGCEISVLHAFVAQGLLHLRSSASAGQPFHSSCLLHLAKAMDKVPTVWLTIASCCALQWRGDLPDSLAEETGRFPSSPPTVMCPAQEYRFCAVVDELRPRIIDALVSSSCKGF